MRTPIIAAGLALAVAAAGATPAAADETFVANYGSLTGMVDGIFGSGNWVRLDDGADQVWTPTGSNVAVLVTATLAAYPQNLGIVQGGAFTPLVTTATPGEFAFQPVSGPFLFADLTGPSGSDHLFTSSPASNPDGQDHMVSFLATDGAFEGLHLLAFEDLLNGGDRDFNDLIFLASGVAPVPEPGTLLLLGGGLAGLLAHARRRRAAA